MYTDDYSHQEVLLHQYNPDSWDPAYPDLWWDKEDVLEWKAELDFSDSLKSWEEREELCG